ILKQIYARSQFSLCTEKFIILFILSDFPVEDICLKKVSKSQLLGNGQAFFKCTCQQKRYTKYCKLCLKKRFFVTLNAI
ncbi:KRAB-A domain-containing protein 2-like, partial [Aphis craccivora]